MLWLVAVVVGIGAVSLVVTGAGRTALTPKPRVSPAPAPGPTLRPLDCTSSQVRLAGAYNACASLETTTVSCEGGATGFDDSFILTSSVHQYTVEIEMPPFAGPGRYELTRETGQVDFYDDNNAEWRSVTGNLTIVDRQGRSGTVDATLIPWVGNISPLSVKISGPWSCG